MSKLIFCELRVILLCIVRSKRATGDVDFYSGLQHCICARVEEVYFIFDSAVAVVVAIAAAAAVLKA